MKFATRLYVGFGMMILLTSILLLLNINVSSKQNEEVQIVQDRINTTKLLYNIRNEVYNAYLDINESQLNSMDRDENMPAERLREINANFEELQSLKLDEQEKSRAKLLKQEIQKFEDIVEILTINYNMDVLEKERLLKALDEHRSIIQTYSSTMIHDQEVAMEEMLQKAKERLQQMIYLGIGSIMFGIIVGVALSFWSINKITTRLRKVKEVMNRVEKGSEELPRIQITNHDEIGEIANAYNEMAAALEYHEKTGRIYKEGIEEQNWLKSHIAELSTLVQDVNDIQTLGRKYISAIVPIVSGSYGVIYIKEEKEGHCYLLKLASYASKEAKDKIEAGENLAGQCLQDGRIIKLTNIPNDYIKISSSLGEVRPKTIIILPIILNEEILGVVEIATIHEFNETHDYLLKRSTDQLGAVIHRIQKQMQVLHLLEETQALNDELQSQSEELQLQQEELRSMNEELEVQNRESEQRTNDLQEAKIALEMKTKQVLLSSQYKSEFLANMSHELRTPLNSLLILAQILEENKEGNLTEKQIQYANTIYASGKDLLNLINEILDISKIESGKLEYEIGEIDIRGIVSFLKNQFSAIAEQKQITFNVEVEEDVPTVLYSDEQKIYQVLKNLLSNAIKFTERGSVLLKVYHSTSDPIQTANGYIAFSVLDTGIGIPDEKQELIFEAFQQADGTTSRKYGGTGLGLSISKGLADLLGGYINVASNENLGSTFTFFLPVDHNQKLELLPERKEAAVSIQDEAFYQTKVSDSIEGVSLLYELDLDKEKVLEGKSILLVDDDMRNVFALVTALEPVGINLFFAENGREAIELLEEKQYVDLILMDIMMPEMDGYEAMQRIKEKPELKEIPIIALTAKAMKDDREKCINAGASDYISKPINLEQLLSVLKVWINK